MPEPRAFHCLFCDDIRHEIGGKISLIGIYNQDIVFNASPPVTWPKLCIHLTIISSLNDFPEHIEISMHGPGHEEIAKMEIKPDHKPEFSPDAQKALMSIGLQTNTITFSQEGYIEVWVTTEQEKTRAGRLKVRFEKSTEEKA